MPIWQLTPIDPSNYNWKSSTYHGVVLVRAGSEVDARGLAQNAFGIAVAKKPSAPIPLMTWISSHFTTCSELSGSAYEGAGPDEILEPEGYRF